MIAPAQTISFTSLFSFNGDDGIGPEYLALVQGTDGNFYGIANTGGANCYPGEGCGTVFKISPSGVQTTLHNFCSQGQYCLDGEYPAGGLVQGRDGNFYGTTERGGANGWGVIYSVSPSGNFNVVYNFCSQASCADGAWGYGGMALGTDGNFYGVTFQGGAPGSCPDNLGCGTVFKLTPSGALTTLHSFRGAPADDGANPRATMVQGRDGNFYGTTWHGGGGVSSRCNPTGCGTVFKITPSGTTSTVYTFCSQANCTDGDYPYAGLVQASDGNFYGTTTYGGSSGCATFGCGTAFKLTPAGSLSTLYTFCSRSGCSDGQWPYGTLVQSSANGNFYGTTVNGGGHGDRCPGGCGTVYKMTAAGALSTLHIFGGPDGGWPRGGLVQSNTGAFYGTTYEGGTYGDYGTVFLVGDHGICATCHP